MEKTALISVSNKEGLYDFAADLLSRNWKILSTGGTYKKLTDEWSFRNVESIGIYTDYPECFDGRVKTLHPKIHGGILMRRDKNDHSLQAGALDITPIDMVAVNLYPFEQVVAQGKEFEECIENIDIGGVALLRAAAKNFQHVIPVCDINDYRGVINAIDADYMDFNVRAALAHKVFALISHYDMTINQYMEQELIYKKML